MPAKLNLTGLKFSRWTVLHVTKQRCGRTFMWECLCECGTKRPVSGAHLKSGKSRSCGCLQKETLASIRTTHGACKNRERQAVYVLWSSMKRRCNNPNAINYRIYGGRGIKVCAEWDDSFEAFRDYISKLPNCPKNIEEPDARLDRQIDRIRNNEGYKPGNVKWSTRSEQMNNTSVNKFVTVNGTRMTLRQAAAKYGKVKYPVIYNRLERGWSYRDAFLTPLKGVRL